MWKAIFAAALITSVIAEDTCTFNSCKSACAVYDSVFGTCAGLNDTINFVTCSCSAINGILNTYSLLNMCVACDDASAAGALPLYAYQRQSIICDSFLYSGQDIAVREVITFDTGILVSLFSRNSLGSIQSTLCTGSSTTKGTGDGWNDSYSRTTVGMSVAASMAAAARPTPVTTTVLQVFRALYPNAEHEISRLTATPVLSVLTSPVSTFPVGATTVVTLQASAAAPTPISLAGLAMLAALLIGALL